MVTSSSLPFTFQQQPSPDLTSVQITGARVVLRPVHEGDAAVIFQEFDAEITRYMYPKPAVTIADTLAFIQNSWASMYANTDLILAITLSDGEFLGCCGLHGTSDPRVPEFGIWLKKAAHGHRYGRDAIATLARWAVETLVFDYAIYPVDQANIPSRKIAESLGGVVIAHKTVKALTGNILNEVVYQIPYATLASRCPKINLDESS